MASGKTKTIQLKIKEIEPKLYTLIFNVNGTLKSGQVVAYDLEQAVKDVYVPGGNLQNLRLHFSLDLGSIQQKFKNVR